MSVPMGIAVLGIDLGKTVCSLAGIDCTGAVVLRRCVRRFRLLEFLAQLSQWKPVAVPIT